MVYFPRTQLYGYAVGLGMNQINMILNGEESEISENDIVRRTNAHPASMEPALYLAMIRYVFWKTEEAYDKFTRRLYAEYLEWSNASEPEREGIRKGYCDRYAFFNVYSAINYLTSLLRGSKINVKFGKELLYTVMVDLGDNYTFENMDEYKKALAILGEEITEDTQDDPYKGEKDRIRGLLKAYLSLNKQQLDSLRKCSIIEFGIRKRINHEFLTFLKLRPLWDRLRYLYNTLESKIHDLDRQLWLDISSLDDVLENDSTIETVQSRMTEWTYADAMFYGHKVIGQGMSTYWQKVIGHNIVTDNLDPTNVPQSENFVVTLENTFDPECKYDYMSACNKLRSGMYEE